MQKIKNWFDKLIEFIIKLVMGAMCLTVFWQVISRFVVGDPSSWTEEIAKYFMIWIAFLAGAMGLKTGSHMGLTLLEERIHNRVIKLCLKSFDIILCGLVGALFLVYGYQYMVAGMAKLGSAIAIPMGYVYAVIPLSGLVVILNTMELLGKMWNSRCNNQSEEEMKC